MKIPQLKKKSEIKTCHNISWEDDYSWIHQDDILEVLKDSKKLTLKLENILKKKTLILIFTYQIPRPFKKNYLMRSKEE